MKQITWIPAALAAVVTVGPAAAQGNRPGGRTGQQPQPFTQTPRPFQQTPRPFNQQPWVFVPGQGLMPPGGQVTSPFGLDPAFSPRAVSGKTQFTPSTGGGYGGGWYYPGYSGYYYPGYGYPGGTFYPGQYSGTYLPQYGTSSSRAYVAPPGGGIGSAPRSGETARQPAPVDREQAKLAQSAEELMAKRAFRSGIVVKVGDKTLEVRVQVGGEEKIRTVPAEEVFFFRDNGELATAASSPKALKAGDRVMVPEPEEKSPKEPK